MTDQPYPCHSTPLSRPSNLPNPDGGGPTRESPHADSASTVGTAIRSIQERRGILIPFVARNLRRTCRVFKHGVPFALSACSMTMKLGMCGFTIGAAAYFRQFKVVEVQQTFYDPPSLSTLEKWRQEAQPSFEFTMKAWQ